MANHEWGSWGWTAEHMRTLGEGLVGVSLLVAVMSVFPSDEQSKNTMRIAGGATGITGAVMYLLGRIGQKDHF